MAKPKLQAHTQEILAEEFMNSLKRENPKAMNAMQIAMLQAVVKIQEKGSILLNNK